MALGILAAIVAAGGAVITGATAAVGAVMGTASAVGNFLPRLPPEMNYILFTAIVGIDASIGLFSESIFGVGISLGNLLLLPINIMIGSNYNTGGLFIILVLFGLIIVISKAAMANK